MCLLRRWWLLRNKVVRRSFAVVDGDMAGVTVPSPHTPPSRHPTGFVAGAFLINAVDRIQDRLAGYTLGALAAGPVFQQAFAVAEFGSVGVGVLDFDPGDGDVAVEWFRFSDGAPAARWL